MLVIAKRMIAERFDDSALGCGASCAGPDHARQFVLKRSQLVDARANGIEVHDRDTISVCTRTLRMIGEVQHGSDVAQFESEGARMPNKTEPAHLAIRV